MRDFFPPISGEKRAYTERKEWDSIAQADYFGVLNLNGEQLNMFAIARYHLSYQYREKSTHRRKVLVRNKFAIKIAWLVAQLV